MVRGCHSPPSFPPHISNTQTINKNMGVLARKKKQDKRAPTTRPKGHDVLKVVHPKRVEVYRIPITAGEILDRYPRHCIARPDVFEYPWIVVRPEAILVPGKVFYLVPYHTMYNLLKSKAQEYQSHYLSPKHSQYENLYHEYYNNSPANHQQQERHYRKQTPYHHSTSNVNDRISYCDDDIQGQDSDTGSYYKPSFYKTWDKMGSNLIRADQESFDQLDFGLDSPLDGGWSCFSMIPSGRPHVTSPKREELLRIKSCMRKPDSVRKGLNLKVSFESPVVTWAGSRRGSPPSDQEGESCFPSLIK